MLLSNASKITDYFRYNYKLKNIFKYFETDLRVELRNETVWLNMAENIAVLSKNVIILTVSYGKPCY